MHNPAATAENEPVPLSGEVGEAGSASSVGSGEASEWKFRGPMPIDRGEFC